jgi:hypothetical protein
VDQLLSDTLNYFRNEYGVVDALVESLVELRLEQYSRDKFTFQQQSNQLDHSDYHLMGALMLRYDSTSTKGTSPKSWCLYLRSYMDDADGSIWRILLDDDEGQSVSHRDETWQALNVALSVGVFRAGFSRHSRRGDR